MGLLADWQIRQLVKIEPFADEAHRPGVVSYGRLQLWLRRARGTQL